MKKIIKVTWMLGALFFASNSFAGIQDLKSAMQAGVKVIDNFDKEGVWSWWGSSAIKIEQDVNEGALKVIVTNAGDKAIDNGYSTFGRDHSAQTLDFSEYPVVKLRCKTDKATTIRLNVKDIDGFVNNKHHSTMDLPGDNKYHDLYFDFNGKWEQNYPNDGIVDEEEIKEFLLFVNPGGASPYTGVIYIDELSIMDEKP